MTGFGQDVRFAARQLRRHPVFAIVATLTVALGVAATTTVFSFMSAAVVRPLPYPDPGRLFVLWTERGEVRRQTGSYLNFVDWQARTTTFASLALYQLGRLNVSSAAGPARLRGAFVSADFFRTLGIVPARGRDFRAGEDRRGNDQVVVVSDRFWRDRMAADPAALGKTLRVDGGTLAVIGVMPPGVGYPAQADLWVPISHEAKWLLESRGLQGYTVVGRLRPGVEPPRAQAEMSTIAKGLAAAYPGDNEGWGVRLEPLKQAISGDVRPTLWLLFASAGVLLLVAGVNLANMLLARSTAREREIAVRRAVGAGTGRLVRQLMTESVVLTALGGALGVLCAVWGVQLWSAGWEKTGGSIGEVQLDWRVLLFALTVTLATALVFGAVPAIRTTRLGVGDLLRQQIAGSWVRRRAGLMLVTGEIALALLLGIGGSLLVQSLLRLQSVDPGFDSSRVFTARISLPESTYPEPKNVITFYQRLLDEVAALPGVQAAAAADAVPLIPGGGRYGFSIQGRPVVGAQDWPIADVISTTSDYFRALSIPLRRGRAFDRRDATGTPDVAVVNESMARHFWPGQDPVGARITFEADRKHWIEIVGVVGDVRNEKLGDAAESQIFLAQPQWGDRSLSLVVRSDGDPMQLAGPVGAILNRIDPELPLAEPRTMDLVLQSSLVPERVRAIIVSSFAGLALLLAGVGIYGVIAYLVTQREREIAVRMALGARSGEVLASVLGGSLQVAAGGIALGLLGALALGRLLRGFLFGVTPTDPFTLVLISLGVAGLVTGAALIPARRAARTDPAHALRSE